MRKSLVSILTPCYNGGELIHKLLDSILMQTYHNIEMFVINDGSTDNTEEVVLSYVPKFREKGYDLHCINQSNQGQGAAINNGLKLITGEFLIWPDSDDYFASKNAIKQMIDAMNMYPELSIARTFSNKVDENTKAIIGEFSSNEKQNPVDLFEDCLFAKNGFWFVPGGYILRVADLFEIYPDKDIYPSTRYGGQNWQLMLPMFYKSKCYNINENLYNVVVRSDSHSRGTFISPKDLVKKYDEHRRIILTTLKYISKEVHEKYKNRIYLKYESIIIRTLSKEDKKSAIKKYYSLLISKGHILNVKDHIRIIASFIR